MSFLNTIIDIIAELIGPKIKPTEVTTTPQPTEKPTEVTTTPQPTEKPTEYNNICVMLDHGHCKSTPGKCSPDKRLLEYAYAREIVKGIEEKLDELGIEHWNTHPEEDFVIKDKGTCKSLDSRDLVLRKTRVNNKYSELKNKGIKSFLVSVHVNAAGTSGWNTATGWETYSTKGQNNSDKLADCMYDAAEEILKPLNKKIRVDNSDGDRDKESDFYILKNSNCICVLTENFFQDNKTDVDWLLSDKGKQAIIDIHIQGILKYINKI